MTNWDFYGWSYQLAQYAFDCWCHICQTSHSIHCEDSTACEICQARWYTLPFKTYEYAEVRKKAEQDYGMDFNKIGWESNSELEDRISKIHLRAKNHRADIAKENGWDSYRGYWKSGYRKNPPKAV